MKPHQRLEAWKQSFDIVAEIYRVTALFPASEKFGMVSQIRRAAVSIPTNLAEGASRTTKKEFLHFINISRGSLSELDTLLLLAAKLGFLDDSSLKFLSDRLIRISMLLNGLARKINADIISQH
jgi:four helix bundle protein